MLNTMKIRYERIQKRYDEDIKNGRNQTFISKFKNRKLRRLEKESNKRIKELEDEMKRLNLQLAN